MNSGAKKILFVASDAYPLVKTGGLGDVVYSLSRSEERRVGKEC